MSSHGTSGYQISGNVGYDVSMNKDNFDKVNWECND